MSSPKNIFWAKNHTQINCSEAVDVIRAKLDRSRLRRPVETREIIDSVRNAYSPNYSIERISSVMNGKTAKLFRKAGLDRRARKDYATLSWKDKARFNELLRAGLTDDKTDSKK